MLFDITTYGLSLLGTDGIRLSEFRQDQLRFLLEGIPSHISLDHLLITGTVLGREMGALQMVVDDQHCVLADLQIPSYRTICFRLIRNTLTTDDRITRVDTHTVRKIGISNKEDGVVVGIDLLITMEDVASPSVHILLQTDDVGILTGEAVIDDIESLIILITARKCIPPSSAGYSLKGCSVRFTPDPGKRAAFFVATPIFFINSRFLSFWKKTFFARFIENEYIFTRTLLSIPPPSIAVPSPVTLQIYGILKNLAADAP